MEFHAIWDIGIFYRWIANKVEWFYYIPNYLFKLTIRIQKRGSLPKGTSFIYSLNTFVNTNVVSIFGKAQHMLANASCVLYSLRNHMESIWLLTIFFSSYCRRVGQSTHPTASGMSNCECQSLITNLQVLQHHDFLSFK